MPSSNKKNRISHGTPFIFHSPDPHEVSMSVWERPQWAEIEALLGEKRFTVKDSDISYRTINHWMSEGLLPDEREDASGWRKLSLKDLLWLGILQELRSFGLPLEKLRRAYETIDPASPWFEVVMALCVQKPPVPFFVVVFNDGTGELASLRSLRVTDCTVGYERPYIRINLNALCCKLFRNDKLMPEMAFSDAMFETELEYVRQALRTRPDELHLRMRDGVVDEVATTKTAPVQQRIVDLMQENPYAEITIKTQDQKPVHVKVTKKRKRK